MSFGSGWRGKCAKSRVSKECNLSGSAHCTISSQCYARQVAASRFNTVLCHLEPIGFRYSTGGNCGPTATIVTPANIGVSDMWSLSAKTVTKPLGNADVNRGALIIDEDGQVPSSLEAQSPSYSQGVRQSSSALMERLPRNYRGPEFPLVERLKQLRWRHTYIPASNYFCSL